MTRAAKAFYGASPWHLVALLGCFAVAGYAVTRVLDDPLALVMLAWFVGAVIGHDLILFPVYALADLSLAGVLRAGKAPARVPPVNHIRIPVLATALTFVLFFPGIIRQGSETYAAATGLTQEPFLARWLVLVGVMFATSGLVYAIRVRVAHAPDRRSLALARDRVRDGERVLVVSAVPGSEPDAVGTADALYYRDVDGHWARVGLGGTVHCVRRSGPEPAGRRRFPRWGDRTCDAGAGRDVAAGRSGADADRRQPDQYAGRGPDGRRPSPDQRVPARG